MKDKRPWMACYWTVKCIFFLSGKVLRLQKSLYKAIPPGLGDSMAYVQSK
ncbi:hypothetical protein Hanom_Chr14g01260211 [Helianthus anomalus]